MLNEDNIDRDLMLTLCDQNRLIEVNFFLIKTMKINDDNLFQIQNVLNDIKDKAACSDFFNNIKKG
jgi:hypothetical protein